jgi:hypothetical protein
MADKEQPVPQPKYVITKAPSGVLETYANYVDLNWTTFEVRLRFCQLMQPSLLAPSAETPIEERAGITVSWGQLKILRNMLTDAINRYEKVNGEIRTSSPPI